MNRNINLLIIVINIFLSSGCMEVKEGLNFGIKPLNEQLDTIEEVALSNVLRLYTDLEMDRFLSNSSLADLSQRKLQQKITEKYESIQCMDRYPVQADFVDSMRKERKILNQNYNEHEQICMNYESNLRNLAFKKLKQRFSYVEEQSILKRL